MKRLIALDTMSAVIPRLRNLRPFDALQRVSLSLDSAQFLKFIGFQANASGFSPYGESAGYLGMLTDIPVLQHLHLDFESFMRACYVDDAVFANPGHTVRRSNWATASCQEAFVE